MFFVYLVLCNRTLEDFPYDNGLCVFPKEGIRSIVQTFEHKLPLRHNISKSQRFLKDFVKRWTIWSLKVLEFYCHQSNWHFQAFALCLYNWLCCLTDFVFYAFFSLKELGPVCPLSTPEKWEIILFLLAILESMYNSSSLVKKKFLI